MTKTSVDKRRMKVLLLEGIHPGAIECFQTDGYTQIEYHDKSLPEGELLETIGDAFFLGIRSRTQLTPTVLGAAAKLAAVGCFCIGTNQVDLQFAKQRGIPVFNAPFSNTRSVAELILAEIILLLRDVPRKNAAAHRGCWLKTAVGAREARGKRLGIVGYGRIGTQVGLLAEAVGMRVYFHDIEPKLALGNATALPSLNALLELVDVVTLHVPETVATQNLIDADRLVSMAPGAMLINASRGGVVDIDALARSLASGHLGGAAIDVFPVEPSSNDDELVSSLRGLENVILTPHVGGSTLEAQENIGLEVSAKLIQYSNNGTTRSAVNFPQVSLPAHPGSHRLLHIHRNGPGVLSQVNDVFSRDRINIDAQYLQTDNAIGYVVIDVDVDEAAARSALRQLRAIPGTIRARILY